MRFVKIGFWCVSALAAMLLVGTGGTVAAATKPLKITLAGGSVGGAWSAMGAAIGETISRETPGSAFTYEPGVDGANVQLVSMGRVQLGIAHAQMALRGVRDLPPFRHKVSNIEAIALLDPAAVLQIIVREDSKIKSLDQIKKNQMPLRVALNKRGTMMAVAGEEAFKAAGITIKDIQAWGGRVDYVSLGAGLNELKNGQVNMVISMLAYPAAHVNEAARNLKLRLIGLSKPEIATLDSDIGTKAQVIPGGAYAFQPKAVKTVTGKVVLIASDQMPDAEAEIIAKGLIDHYNYLKKAYPSFTRMSPEMLPDVAPLTLHPGAAMAYKAAGFMK